MEYFSSSMIFIMAFSTALELGLVAGLGYRETAPGDDIRSREEPVIRDQPLQFVPFVGIQDSKQLNKTCCLNGGTCMLGSFCACPPYFYGRNCEHDVRKENCGPVPHDTWLSKKCSLCKCWNGWLRCFPQTFLPGCDGHAMDEHLPASRTPELRPSERLKRRPPNTAAECGTPTPAAGGAEGAAAEPFPGGHLEIL
ncbi:PREDICTED: teratocarcinoma-derived growth factor 1 [Chrysochloris asiatica]|uniref:Teratocarcinoma-derived growth factor 1 n=1 Tax=Chrysochloris asiatica TaxID=185453 RepID=A0A9B0WU57_CHRAS|nr:PREDICTED: teratocarcinoma-derived growth factor 1 [Chrysochloris asiatica]